MWDGNFIEYELRPPEGLCHGGNIEFMALEGEQIVTAGADGHIKAWPMKGLEFAEPDENGYVTVRALGQHCPILALQHVSLVCVFLSLFLLLPCC